MFGNKNQNANSSSSILPSPSHINTLGEGTNAEGNINTTSDLRVDGNIKGTVNCGGKLIVGPTGFIDGDITSSNAVIEGTINGNIIIHEVLDIRESATVTGEVKTNKLLVQNGATFTGNCDMGHKVKHISKKEVTA